MSVNWSSVGSFFKTAYKGAVKFVGYAAPVAAAVGTAIGNPEVTAAAKAATAVDQIASQGLEEDK